MRKHEGGSRMNRLDITAVGGVKALLKSRYPQLVILALMLTSYIFAIMAGLIGSPVGSSNFSIVFVWIAWWALLILVAVPLLGRGWCAICPIPLPGEWMQRGAVLGPSGRRSRRLNLRWPRALRSIWLQSAFLMLALSALRSYSPTYPSCTDMLLAHRSEHFEKRSFCRYLCTVGGFIGLYSQVAPIELRIKHKPVCVTCDGKPCYNGSAQGYGCPWDVFPGGLTRNTYCGLPGCYC
jgi:polyferredoxin